MIYGRVQGVSPLRLAQHDRLAMGHPVGIPHHTTNMQPHCFELLSRAFCNRLDSEVLAGACCPATGCTQPGVWGTGYPVRVSRKSSKVC